MPTRRIKKPPIHAKCESLPEADAVGGVFVSTRNILSSNVSLDTATTMESSPPTSWRSSGSLDFTKNVPLVASDPENPSKEQVDDAVALGRIMARSRQLPTTWYFASNHIMVNQERTRRTIAPLVRMRELDAIAREHAERMASKDSLFHSTPIDLAAKFNRPSRRLGENVGKGATIREIHQSMMKIRSDKNNILDRRYTHMGMATAQSSDGTIYLCQVFRG